MFALRTGQIGGRRRPDHLVAVISCKGALQGSQMEVGIAVRTLFDRPSIFHPLDSIKEATRYG